MISLQRFSSDNIETICDYIESIKEFEEITNIVPKDRSVSEEKLRGMLDSNESIGVVAVDTETSKIVGVAMVALVEMWWTSSKLWNNILLFVDPAYRKTNTFNMLTNFFKAVSKTTDIPLYFDIFSGPETNFKVYDRVFSNKGFKRIGTAFIYNEEGDFNKKAA